ncbi:DUF3592 domain-containing protein [Butyrivibrio fibrisolvens]|jgi:hypothetical protein|uniref:DUF3592 domain-containing protein n=1 Tax=Butyrivibrio fibrisolvens TaxID=831 RepID=UPI0003B55EED|nr:DUF3592 domain-containing protein [Butyrivibrio fibrisolvens]
MEMKICISGIVIVFLLGIVLFGALFLITQVLLGFRCKNKIEAVLVDVEISKTEDGSQRVAVPHESRYSKYSSYSYKPKKEFVNKKTYRYAYSPVYQYEYDNYSFTRHPVNNLDYFDNKVFEKKNYKIGQKCYIYIDPKRPAVCMTKRFSLMNTIMAIFIIAGGCYMFLAFLLKI